MLLAADVPVTNRKGSFGLTAKSAVTVQIWLCLEAIVKTQSSSSRTVMHISIGVLFLLSLGTLLLGSIWIASPANHHKRCTSQSPFRQLLKQWTPQQPSKRCTPRLRLSLHHCLYLRS